MRSLFCRLNLVVLGFQLLIVQASADVILNPRDCVDGGTMTTDTCVVAGDTGYACDDPFTYPGSNPSCSGTTPCHFPDGSTRDAGTTREGDQAIETEANSFYGPGDLKAIIASEWVCATQYHCTCITLSAGVSRCQNGNVNVVYRLRSYCSDSTILCLEDPDEPVDPPQ